MLSGCEVRYDPPGYVERESKRFVVSGTPEITLTTFDGSIEVRGWDRSEVVVEVEKRAATRELVSDIEVTSEQDGTRVRVEAHRPNESRWMSRRGRQAKLIASVPKSANLLVRSDDGAIVLERVEGRIEARTADGSVRCIEVQGDVLVHTGEGSVRLEGARGRFDVTTGDGSITLAGEPDTVKAHTGDGSVTLRVKSGVMMAADWDISTGDGGVMLYLPRDFSASLDAYTGDGRIRNDLTVEAMDEESRSRRTLRGQLGGGGRLLKVRTGDGSIALRPS